MRSPPERGVLDLRNALPWARRPGVLNQWAFAGVERVLGYHRLDRHFTRATKSPGEGSYFRHLVEEFELEVSLTGAGLEGIPREGPVILVANHPFGGADAMAVGDLAMTRRSDSRVLSNEFMYSVEILKPRLIPVDVYGGAEAKQKNLRAMREASRHLSGGGLLVVFPAGEVASWNRKTGQVEEASWAPHLGALARRTRARIVPVFIPGTNSKWFHGLGRVHPLLRTAWLGRELLGHQGTAIELRVGRPIEPDAADDAEAITAEVREALFRLAETG